MSNNVEYIISLRDKFSTKLVSIQNQVDNLDKKTNIFKGTLGSLSGVLGGIGFGAAAISVLKLGMNMEQAKVAFTVFLGSAEKANKALADLNEFANVTPYDNAEVIDTGKSLLAFGVGADDLTGTLRKLGDVASGLNVPLNEMAQIYGKAMNKGKLQAEELNQLSERGVPIMQALADKFGVQKDQVYKLAEQGKITFSVFNEAFSSMSANGGDFFQMMEKQSETTSGKLSTLVGNAQMLGITIAEKLMPTVNMLIDKFMVLVSWMQTNSAIIISTIKFIAQLAKYYIIYLAALKAVSYATKIATIMNTALRISYVVMQKGIKGAITSMKGFKVALAQTGIGLAVIAVSYLVEKYMEFGSEIDRLQEKLKTLKSGVVFSPEKTLLKQFGLVNQSGLIERMIGVDLDKVAGNFDLSKIQSSLEIINDLVEQFQGRLTSKGGQYKLEQSIKNLEEVRKVLEEKQSKIEKTLPKRLNGQTIETETKETKITSSAPKVFNINIDKLVENFTVSTSTLKESTNEIKEAVLNALLGSLNDTQIVLNQ
jgi:tape measure domain-containing protein